MTTKPNALLSFIRGAETRKGYDDFYSGSVIAPPKPPSQMTVREIQQWQEASVRAGSKSSAIGGYQIISKTFAQTARNLGMTGDELFDAETQDKFGMALLEGRGFSKWQAGQMSDDAFANNLASEWAALPLASGKSAYHGDGLNASTRGRGDILSALSATRNGEDVDLSGLSGSDASGVTWGGPTAEAQGRQNRMSLVDPMNSPSGVDLGDVAKTGFKGYRTVAEEKAAEAAAAAAAPGFFEGSVLAADEQWVGTNLARQLGRDSFLPQAGFKFDDDLWKETTEGLPEVYQEALYEAVSPDHARALADELRISAERDQKLASMGWTGVGLQFGAALLDPIAIAASAATEGMAAPLIYGAKIGKLGRFLRAGAVGAGTNAAIDGYLISQDPISQWDGIAYSAAAGFLLGGTVGALRRSDMDPQINTAMKGVMREIEAKEAGAVAPDGSLSAAQVPGTGPKLTDAETLAERFADTSKSSFGRLRIDMVGRLKQSENPIMRKLASVLDEDAVGNADGSVSLISANEKAVRHIKKAETRFYKTYNSAFQTWAKEEGHAIAARFDPTIRARFNNEVGMAVRRPLDGSKNAHVQKVAASLKAEYADLHRFGVEANVRGFSEFGPNDLYLNRSHNIQAIDDLVAKHGSGKVHQTVAEALVSGDRKWRNTNKAKAQVFDELEYEDALDIAKAYLKSVRSRKYGSFSLNQAMSGVDDDVLRQMLLDEGLDFARVNTLVDRLTKQVDSNTKALGKTAGGKDVNVTSERGRVGNAKRRLNLDEEYFSTSTGIRIEDLLENDAEALFTNYSHSVIRAGYLEEAFSTFKLPDANGDLPAHAPSLETIKRYIAETNTVSGDKGKAEMALLDTLYKAVRGLPQEPDAAWKQYSQRLRSWNFTRVMGQLGVAQLSEFGMILGNGGMKAFFQHMPMLRKITAMAHKGQLGDRFMDEVESIWSFGTDVLRHSPAVRMEDGSGVSFAARGGVATMGQKVDFGLNQGKAFVATVSGMSHINRTLQRFNGRVLVQRFLDHAHGGRQINMRRFKAMGIDEAMADQISDQIRKHMSYRKGILGKSVSAINIENWTDIDAKNAFINGVDRWSRRSVQENNPGAMPAFMTKETGKLIGQFRSFMLGAYTKQLLSGAQARDWETFSSFAASMFFGGIAYIGQTQINSFGKPNREDWLNERLSTEAIAKASFQRAGMSSVLPMLSDTVLAPFTDEPIFAYRTTDLSTGIWGNPTTDLLNTLGSATKGILASASRDDYQFSQQDFREVSSLMFLQNGFGIRNILAGISGELPRFSQ